MERELQFLIMQYEHRLTAARERCESYRERINTLTEEERWAFSYNEARCHAMEDALSDLKQLQELTGREQSVGQ